MTKQQKAIIRRLMKMLSIRYKDDPSGHDWFHLERAWKMAMRLSKGEKVNPFVVEMAALLHDVDDYKFKKEGEAPLGQTEAILNKLGVVGAARTQILDIISHVSFKGGKGLDRQHSLEGKIVQDADRLEALGAMGIARTFIYNGYIGNLLYDPKIKPTTHKSFQSYKDTKGTAINHFYEKLLLIYDRLNTPQAKKIAHQRDKFLRIFLDEFLAEWEGKR